MTAILSAFFGNVSRRGLPVCRPLAPVCGAFCRKPAEMLWTCLLRVWTGRFDDQATEYKCMDFGR